MTTTIPVHRSPARACRRSAVALTTLVVASCLGIATVNSAPKGGASAAALRAGDARLPRPRPLPTIAAISWGAFPDDLKGPYGQSGRQHTVRPGRANVLTEAVAQARKGDTIIVAPGTYHEGNVAEGRALYFERDGVVLRTLPGQRARVVARPGVKRAAEIQASHVMIQGLDFADFEAGIGLGKGNGGTVRGTILSDLTLTFRKDGAWHDGIVAYPDNRGVNKPSVDGLLLRNVTIDKASLSISCNAGPCRSWWLENVTVRAAGGHGSGADAIAIEEGENIVMVNVDVSGATADGIDTKAKHVLVLNSHVHDVARNGIKLWRGGDIVNTVVHHTGADSSLVFKEGARYRVLHSVMAFHNHGSGTSYSLTAGHDTRAHLDVELVNSIFYNTSGGMFFSDNTTTKIQGCIFFGMENGKVLQASASGKPFEIMLAGGASAIERARLGSNNQFVDPRFVAPAKGDFRLQPSSPAIDRGKPTAAYPPTDRSGGRRVRGAGPDLGAYELR